MTTETAALARLREQVTKVERANWDVGRDVHPDVLFCLNYQDALSLLGRLDPPDVDPRFPPASPSPEKGR